MDELARELPQAARRLLRAPGFTVATVLTLALAIGANIAIFTIVNRVVLNPLPYPDSARLIELDHASLSLNLRSGMGLTSGLYFHYAERARTLDSLVIYRTEDVTLTGDGDPEQIRVSHVTPSLAAVLRVKPATGRWFTEAEGQPNAARVAVISEQLLRRRFGSATAIVGRSILLDGLAAEIVGVMPADFSFPDPRVEVWVAEPAVRATGFGLWTYDGIARLRPSVTMADLQSEMRALIADVPQAFPNDSLAKGNSETRLIFSGRTLHEATVGNVARGLWILLVAVGLLLLVACANVANLFLVRSDTRQREVAVRRALGAGHAKIARYFLVESGLLSVAGGLAGLGLAWVAVRAVVAFGPANLPRLAELGLDAVVLTFAVVLCALTALLFGALPLWHGTGLAAGLRENGRGNTATRARHRTRHLLMGAQMAVALVLLVASGLLVKSFEKMRAVDPGFEASSALTFTIGLPQRKYSSVTAVVDAHRAMLEKLAAVPGIQDVSATSCLPLMGGCFGNTVRVEGRTYSPGTLPPIALFRAVAADYFETMGMRVLRGRGITRDDVDRREPIVVINDAFARRAFPNQDPIGQRLSSNRPPARRDEPPELTWLTIVGVVTTTPLRVVAEPDPLSQLYMPMSIAGGPGIPQSALVGPDISVMRYVVRTSAPPQSVLPTLRRAVASFDPDLALAEMRTLQELLDRASAQMAFTMTLLAVAAGVALLLGVIGIYAAMSYIVSQRTGEIGVRLALGADPATVARVILRQGGLVSLAGIGVGLTLAVGGVRLIESLLFGISPRDPGVFASTTLLLLAIALVACWLPARRAARLSPVEALRTE